MRDLSKKLLKSIMNWYSIGVEDKNIIRFAFDKDEDIDKLEDYYKDEPSKIY